jgi:hypothetical protein
VPAKLETTGRSRSQGAPVNGMNITIHGTTYRVTTEADIICLLGALDILQALARRKAA